MSAACLTRTALLLASDFFPGLPEEEIVAGLMDRRVLISADAATCASPAGQSAVAQTALLVSQLGAEVFLELPAAPLLAEQPPFPRGADLAGSLQLGSPGLTRPFRRGAPDRADLAIAIGADPRLGAPTARRRLWLSSGDWGCELTASPGPGAGGTLPFGATLGAVAAAAECLRSAVVAIAARHRIRLGGEHHLGEPRPLRLGLPAFDLGVGLDLGRVDLVSAGAITNALLAVVLRVAGLVGELRVIDDDRVSLDNLNRCGLFTRAAVGEWKVEVLAAYGTADLAIVPRRERFEAANLPDLGPLAPRLVVGADHIPSRWFAQSTDPRWLAVAGTSHFDAVASEHRPGTPCAACLHPRDDPDGGTVPTISFVSALAGLLAAHRLLGAAAGAPQRPPTWAWTLALHEPRAITAIGQSFNPACPLGCGAGAALAA